MSEWLSFDRHLLPPLAVLRAFESAARLGSFTLAAEELHLTQGAISRQIKQLEDQLGVRMFSRVRQRIVITEAGRYYAGHVHDILSRLMAAGAQTVWFNETDYNIHLGIIPTFCSRWIMPRLPEFLDRNPRMQMRIAAVGPDLDLAAEDFDAVIVVGQGNWSDTITNFLLPEELVPIATPDWARRFGIRSPVNLLGSPLLQQTARPDIWTNWFILNGLDAGARVPGQLALEQISMLVEAAIAHLGAALLPRALVARELESGILIELPGKPLIISDGYFLVYPKHKQNYPALASFRSWLLEYV